MACWLSLLLGLSLRSASRAILSSLSLSCNSSGGMWGSGTASGLMGGVGMPLWGLRISNLGTGGGVSGAEPGGGVPSSAGSCGMVGGVGLGSIGSYP